MDVAWSERVPIEHRLASRFGNGPVFLAGDAAHAYSPAGGQGMNAGIQDALNLGWKLAFAARSGLPEDGALLRSYEQERRHVARRVLLLTDLLLRCEAGTDPLSGLGRGALASLGPHLIPLTPRPRWLEAQGVRLLSQLRWHYGRSTLSIDGGSGSPGPVAAGERLPEAPVTVDGVRRSLHDLTATPGFHVLLSRDARWSPAPSLDRRFVRVHRIQSRPGAGVVIVRPDGYVGIRSPDGRGAGEWLESVGANRTDRPG
ncbi:FAD-dependent monooxygenase [Rhodococcus chondri]|uniref:FAD-dependent monooxygenase n=1 Tax=Rhodococcus chondri TaxID=3065941 RepID=A0ABU7JRM9_9NOCA|nr:FAD-dependent monooxygenase [Rhodococcus sp. CC-R104]MEE2032485.1 FAD-dependent monooxygenase [Rhodococcus sp. CC-R104]